MTKFAQAVLNTFVYRPTVSALHDFLSSEFGDEVDDFTCFDVADEIADKY